MYCPCAFSRPRALESLLLPCRVPAADDSVLAGLVAAGSGFGEGGGGTAAACVGGIWAFSASSNCGTLFASTEDVFGGEASLVLPRLFCLPEPFAARSCRSIASAEGS